MVAPTKKFSRIELKNEMFFQQSGMLLTYSEVPACFVNLYSYYRTIQFIVKVQLFSGQIILKNVVN